MVASSSASCYTYGADLNGVTVTAYAKDANGATGSSTSAITADIDATAPVPTSVSCTNFTNNTAVSYASTTVCTL